VLCVSVVNVAAKSGGYIFVVNIYGSNENVWIPQRLFPKNRRDRPDSVTFMGIKK